MNSVTRQLKVVPWQNSMRFSTDCLGTGLYIDIVKKVFPHNRETFVIRNLIWQEARNKTTGDEHGMYILKQ